MAKLFGIGTTQDSSHGHAEHTHDTHAAHTTHADHAHHDEHHSDIDVEIREERDHEADVGQIAVDVLDLAEELIIVAPVAGVDPALIDIALSRNILTISGERKHAPIYLDAKRMLVEECYYGHFSRSIILPENLAFNKIKATVEYNTIMIHVPKISFFSKTIKIEE